MQINRHIQCKKKQHFYMQLDKRRKIKRKKSLFISLCRSRKIMKIKIYRVFLLSVLWRQCFISIMENRMCQRPVIC